MTATVMPSSKGFALDNHLAGDDFSGRNSHVTNPTQPAPLRRALQKNAPGRRTAPAGANRILGFVSFPNCRYPRPPVAPSNPSFSESLSCLPGLNFAERLAEIWIDSPVLGFRPVRAWRSDTEKVPKPEMFTRCPAFRGSDDVLEDDIDRFFRFGLVDWKLVGQCFD